MITWRKAPHIPSWWNVFKAGKYIGYVYYERAKKGWTVRVGGCYDTFLLFRDAKARAIEVANK